MDKLLIGASYKHMTTGRRINYRLKTSYRCYLKHLDTSKVDQTLVKKVMALAYDMCMEKK